MKMDYINGWQ